MRPDDLRQRFERCVRPAAVLMLAVAANGCSDFFSAEVTGFIKRERMPQDGHSLEPGAGINGVDVRIFLERPNTFDDGDFAAHTTTIDNRSAGTVLPGFFRATVAWETSSPDFGDSGDVQKVWIATRHPESADRIVEFAAVQSGAINLVPDILLSGLRRGPDRVTGEVLMDGVAVDGVRVVLALDDDPEQEFEAETQTFDGQPGLYVLDDVRWDAEAGRAASGTVLVADAEYLSAGPVTVQLSADQTIAVLEPLLVRPSSFFTKLVQGRVVDAYGQGVNGVRVVLRPERARDSGVLAATVSTQVDGVDGVYRFVDFGWSLPNDSELFETYDTQEVTLAVEDGAYVQSPAERDLAVSVGYQQELHVPEELVVSRRPRSHFAALLHGRCVALAEGLAGVEVTAEFMDDEGSHTLVTRTDPDGRYTLLAAWKREDAANAAPTGEDTITVELRFADVELGEDQLKFEARSYLARSWIRPNHVPDAVATVADEDAGM